MPPLYEVSIRDKGHLAPILKRSFYNLLDANEWGTAQRAKLRREGKPWTVELLKIDKPGSKNPFNS